jgi:ketosteroid isomerase-like protein
MLARRRWSRQRRVRGRSRRSLSRLPSIHPWRDLRALLDRALVDAQAEYSAARSTALSANASASIVFMEAERRAQEAARLSATGPSADSIRAYWTAADSMQRAAADARTRAGRGTAPPAAAPAGPSSEPNQVERPVQAPVQPRPPVDTTTPGAVATAPSGPATSAPPERPAAVPPSAPARVQISDEEAIRAVLASYADAYSRLDANAVRAVYPSADVAALQRQFTQMRSQRVQIQGEQIQINGATARVSCTWQVVFQGSAGAAKREAPRILLTFQRTGDAWVIVNRR